MKKCLKCVVYLCSRLDNNFLVCDCSALWLSRLLRERGPQAAATCAAPPELEGRHVADLREADFHCSEYDILLLWIPVIYGR